MGRKNVHGLPEHMRRRPDGSYYLDYYLTQEDGTKRRKQEDLGKIPLTSAKVILHKRLAELAEHKFMVRSPKVTFRDAAEGFLAYSRGRKRSHKQDAEKVEKLVAFFGDRPLDSLTPEIMEGFLNDLKQKGKRVSCRKGVAPEWKPYKPATLNRYIACAKTIVNRAVANRKIDRNPLVGLKLFKESNARDRVLTREEYHQLLDECAPHLVVMVRMAYISAMRQAEILKLRWDQVDLKGGVIRLKPEDTKTAEPREIPLDGDLVGALVSLPRALHSPFVFTYEGRSLGSIKTAFRAACGRAGISDFRFHDLRHCAVTNLRKAGVPTGTIMSISGHKTDAMVRRYDKVDHGDRKEAMERVRRFLDMSGLEQQKTA